MSDRLFGAGDTSLPLRRTLTIQQVWLPDPAKRRHLPAPAPPHRIRGGHGIHADTRLGEGPPRPGAQPLVEPASVKLIDMPFASLGKLTIGRSGRAMMIA